MAEVLLKVEKKKAKIRQDATLPKKGEKGFKKINIGGKLPTILNDEKGKAIEIVAKKVGLSDKTLKHGLKVLEKSKVLPEAKDIVDKLDIFFKYFNLIYLKYIFY